jgi:iron complex outermembrane recepter protein
MTIRSTVQLTAVATVFCGLAHGGPAAVTAAPLADARPAAEATGALQEVTVTARRREEGLQKVPESISVLDQEFLANHPISTALDLDKHVPGLNTNTGNARDVNRFSIRGQGQITYGDPGVVAYFAEVPLASGGAGSGYYYDLENIQVLLGPQGTLFGRNTMGGAVLFQPAGPARERQGYASLDAGSYDNFQIQGMLNIPLVEDKLLLRVAADRRTRRGFTTDVNTGKDYDNIDYVAGRISLAYLPTDDIRNTLLFYGIDSDNHGTGSVLTNINATRPAFTTFPELGTLQQQQAARGPRAIALDGPTRFKIESWAAIDTLSWQLTDQLAFKNIISYQLFRSSNLYDLDGTPLPILQSVDTGTWNNTNNAMDKEAFTEEAQLDWSMLSGNLRWLAGAFYEHDDEDPNLGYATILLGSAGNTRAFNFAPIGQELRSRAAYTQAILDFGQFTPSLSDLHLTAGYRYTRDWKERWNGLQFPDAGVCSAPLVYPDCTDRASGVFKKGTYSLTLDWQATEDVLLYVTRRTGFKSGLFNLGLATAVAAIIPKAVQPETVTDSEIGIKSQFSLGRATVRADVSAYHESYEDMQRTTLFTVPGTTLLGFGTANAASSTIDGVDAQFIFAPTENLEFALNYAWMDAKYDVFFNPAVGDVAGQEMPFAPRHSASAWTSYRLPVTALGEVRAAAELYYRSSVRQSDDRVPGNVISPFGVLNLRLESRNVAGTPLDATLYVNNALDREYKISVTTYYNTAYGVNSAGYGEPRMVGFALKYRF